MFAKILEVTEEFFGSELVTALTGGESSITVSDALDFNEEGGQLLIDAEILTYTGADEATGIITLSGTVASAHAAEAEVFVYPLVKERVAHVTVGDTDDASEPMEARVPHALYGMIPEGPRIIGTDAESVNVEYEADDLVVTDVIGSVPVLSGEIIDPDTLPPPDITDGDPPAASPVPTVRGTLRGLFIRWEQPANNDPMEYEIHVSTSSGFTPSGSTLVGVVQGELASVEEAADGTALLYEVDYFVKMIAVDADGSASASAEVGPTKLNPAAAGDIDAGQITAAHLASVIVLTSLLQTATAGQRVEIDTDGVRLYSPTGEVLVDIPTDPAKDPIFRGEIVAGGLDVIGNALFRGDANRFDASSFTELGSGVANPTTKPSVSAVYEALTLECPINLEDDLRWHGIHYDADGGVAGGVPVYYGLGVNSAGGGGYSIIVEWNASTGAVLRWNSLATGGSWDVQGDFGGITRVGSNLWILRRTTAGVVTLAAIPQNDAELAPITTSYTITSDVFSYATLGKTDAGKLAVVTRDGASGSQFRVLEYDPGDGSLDATHSLTGGTGIGNTSRPTGFYHDGTAFWVARRGGLVVDQVEAYDDTTLAFIANRFFRTHPQSSNKMGGMTWDTTNTRFVTMPDYRAEAPEALFHTDWDWTSESALYWFGYTWYNNGSGAETLVSPLASVDLTNHRRARFVFSHPDMPMVGGIDRHRHYVKRNATLPADADLEYQAATTYVTSETDMPSYMHNYNDAGGAPPSTNTFPDATPAELASEKEPGWYLRGNGQSSFLNVPLREDSQEWFAYQEMLHPAGDEPTPWRGEASGGTISAASAEPGHPGTVNLNVNAASDRAHFRLQTADTLRLGSGRVISTTLLKTPSTLSNGTNRYFMRTGLLTHPESTSLFTAVAGEREVLLAYRDDQNASWVAVTSDGTTKTIVDTGVDVVVSTWYLLEVIVNQDASEAEFWINGVSVHTETGTEIPTSSEGISQAVVLGATATWGAGSRDMLVDALYVGGTLTAARY